jgi:broad specificity phosphatase PhoE
MFGCRTIGSCSGVIDKLQRLEQPVHIGLIRHFPVTEAWPSGWRNSAELEAWRERYDLADAIVGEFNVGNVNWAACLSSDLPRAMTTAATVFQGPIEYTPLLREVELTPFQTGRLRLPIFAWQWLFRLAWVSGHKSQRAARDDFRRRVNAVADRLQMETKDTLVVSHAGMMAYLCRELRRRGFRGPKLRIAKHATVYAYER